MSMRRMITAALFCTLLTSGCVVVAGPPPPPVEVVPVAPYPGAVWVGGYYVRGGGGHYVWVHGHYR
jgi:hypothetical protein